MIHYGRQAITSSGRALVYEKLLGIVETQDLESLSLLCLVMPVSA